MEDDISMIKPEEEAEAVKDEKISTKHPKKDAK
jgi:hypothetical protein